jgi:BsuBI/PstI restriction endonuclease domain/BsuBI/PstI restriction endonuclease HTH domain
VNERLPVVAPLSVILERLRIIFPEGTDRRQILTREMAAKTIFVLSYAGAIEGTGRWVRPDQITRMTDAQSARTDDAARFAWIRESLSGKGPPAEERWYAPNTREPIRDETLRASLQPVGAVVERAGMAKTSAVPRWALAADFAQLFSSSEAEFPDLVQRWRERHLTPAARARIAVVQRGLVGGGAATVLVRFPNGATRRLSPGTSSIIAKAVIEEFAPRFLVKPGVLWVSETSRKDEAQDIELAEMVHLAINPNQLLPDIILVDLGPEATRFVFIEVVSTDGPMSEERRMRFVQIVEAGGHEGHNAAFVTAFLDRSSGVYRKLSSEFAWDSFVWFASEPDKLIAHLSSGEHPRRLFELVDPERARRD